MTPFGRQVRKGGLLVAVAALAMVLPSSGNRLHDPGTRKHITVETGAHRLGLQLGVGGR